ncbi:putative kinase [Paenibacillus turicensis]|uniref:Kinase n=1 Tax=Paenibacillus turicensis TaxID=160487 RepID=A0ABS4FMS8_9BACL|nr:metallophosphoesterase [Paenibacillus turicensis]MBP1903890.1 putative kinase [Paenibacillus turicensis]
MQITFNTHTIIMLVGPTECGKTTFAKQILIPQLQAGLAFNDPTDDTVQSAIQGTLQSTVQNTVQSNVQYISSDEIRQELLGYQYDKYDQVMLEASSCAFHMLFEKLKAVTSFPINAQFVVVDTTGLAEDFRQKVSAIAKQNHYNLEVVLFDYRDRKDYYASDRSKKVITAHLNRMRKEVLGALAREGYHQIHKVRAKDFILADLPNPAYTVEIANIELYHQTFLPSQYNYIVIGDVHECLSSLISLLERYGYDVKDGKLVSNAQLDNTRLVLVGDWIDKGKNTAAIINFLYDNQAYFYFVLGNHENFVYKYLRGELKGIDQDLLNSYFDSTKVLMEDAQLRDKFNHLCEIAKPFYTSQGGQHASFYITHAPCQNKYIGKLDNVSLKHQRNFRLDRTESIEEQIKFVEHEAVSNHPFHIFGHVAAKHAFRVKNKVHVDSGAVHGNKLTGVEIAHKPFFKSVSCENGVMQNDELPILFARENTGVMVHELAEADLRRLSYCTHNQVNFISGTMSPADKNEETGELESLERGLDYFKHRGVGKVVLQPKYMGSRCNIYLNRELEACYAISRNGYKIKGVDLTSIYTSFLNKFGSYMNENQITVMVLDGELLPWRVMGAGLIDRQFKVIEQALGDELSFLAEHGFDHELGKLMNQFEASGFKQEQFKVTKAELNEKYGSAVYQTYKHVGEIMERHVPVTDQQEAFEVYKRQLEIYASDGSDDSNVEINYKPFSILKFIYENGNESIPDWATSQIYSFLSEDEFLVLDLEDEGSYSVAREYFNTLTTTKQMEGVVIKPEYVTDNVVPYMKVRNEQYLSIVYGYDYRFPHKYKKLFKQKNIQRKLKTSLNEYRLGRQMLGVKLADITPENKEYTNIAANLLFEVAAEKEIDPRL